MAQPFGAGQVRAIPNLQIPHDGEVTVWYYHSSGQGVFFADVWRHVEGAMYRLVGKNRIDEQETTEGEYVSLSEIRVGEGRGVLAHSHYEPGRYLQLRKRKKRKCDQYRLSFSLADLIHNS